jgi:PAS domain S-box-containing protein
MSLSRRPIGGRQSSRGLLLAAAAAGLAVAGLFVALISDAVAPRTRLVLVDCALVTAAMCTVVTCAVAARRSAGRRLRLAWGLLSLTAALWCVGNLIWLGFELVSGNKPFPSVADVFFVVALGTAVLALMSFPSGPTGRMARMVSLVDALVIGGSVLFVVSALVLPPLLDSMGGGLSVAVVAAFTTGDIVLLALAVVLLSRAGAGDRLHLGLLVLAFVVWAVADATYAVFESVDAILTDNIHALGWVTAYLLVGLAALAPSGRRIPTDKPTHWSMVGSVLVYGAFLTAVIAAAIHPGMLGQAHLVVIGGVVLALFGARQMLLSADNQALRRGLEQKVAHRTTQLDQLARRLERILDGVAEGIYGVDAAGRINFVNPAAAAMLGHPADAMLGQPAHERFHQPHSDDVCHVQAALRLGEVVRRSDEHYRRRDGSSFPAEIIASPVHGPDARVTGAVVAFCDITQRREIEKMKQEFVAVVSHELRTPLTAIRGSLGLLVGGAVGELPEAAERMVRIALDNSDRLTRLINDILDLERIGSGDLPMEFAVVDAAEVVSATLTALESLAASAGVRLRTGIVQGRVHCDSDRIVQALTNLVGNAIKFSPAGGQVTVSARQENSHVTFEVADQGRGIPPDKIATVFERFQQVDSSDAREKGGTGLGLPITKSIVERHGGRVWVDSVLGQGSTFRFTLPAARPAGASATTSGAAQVLVCDDDPDILEVLGTLLHRQGYATTPVARGRDAVERAVADRPDLILLDLRMPGMSGWEAIAELKSRPETRDIPIVVMSGLSPVADPDLASRTDGWLTKPVDDHEIRQALSQALHGRNRPPTVLVVEDDDDLADVLVTMFRRGGMRAVHAATERDAVQRCQDVEPDVLVLDLQLPQGDGFAVVEALRRHGRLNHVPVIVYSAHDLDMSARDRLRLGKMIFLSKGQHSPQELQRRVVELVHSVASNGAGQQPAESARERA